MNSYHKNKHQYKLGASAGNISYLVYHKTDSLVFHLFHLLFHLFLCSHQFLLLSSALFKLFKCNNESSVIHNPIYANLGATAKFIAPKSLYLSAIPISLDLLLSHASLINTVKHFIPLLLIHINSKSVNYLVKQFNPGKILHISESEHLK